MVIQNTSSSNPFFYNTSICFHKLYNVCLFEATFRIFRNRPCKINKTPLWWPCGRLRVQTTCCHYETWTIWFTSYLSEETIKHTLVPFTWCLCQGLTNVIHVGKCVTCRGFVNSQILAPAVGAASWWEE